MGRDGGRPWDRLVQLWRSWLPLESLTGVAAIMSASRDEDSIVLSRRDSFTTQASGSRLHDVFDVAGALGDDLITALSGLAIYTGTEAETLTIDRAAERLRQEGVHLTDHWSALRLRRHPHEVSETYLEASLNGWDAVPPPHVATSMEVLDRTSVPLRLVNVISIYRTTPPHGPYEAHLEISLKDKLEPRALPAFFAKLADESVEALASKPFAAAAFRAAADRTDNPPILSTVAQWEANTADTSAISCADTEAAVSLAILAFNAGAPHLCDLAMKSVLEELTREQHTILNITSDHLRCIADVIRSQTIDSETSQRIEGVIVDLAEYTIPSNASFHYFEMLVQLARISNDDRITRRLRRAMTARAGHGEYLGVSEQTIIASAVAYETGNRHIIEELSIPDLASFRRYLWNAFRTLTVDQVRGLQWAAAQLPGSAFAEIVAELPVV
jgi:hypothetical protein